MHHFRTRTTNIVIAFFMSLLALNVTAQEFDEGIEYIPINPPVATRSGDKVEVVELFWYGCPHCFHFEPSWEKWIAGKPDNVAVVRVPAIFRDSWIPGARAFYTAQFLGVLDKTHKAIFEAIHVKKQKFRNAGDFAKIFAKFGVAEKDFLDTYNSFAVDAKVRRAKDLTGRYQIDGVPTLVVNGKFRTTGSIANGHDGMLKVLDYLVRKESGTKSAK